MQDGTNEVWRWSEAFTEIVEGLIRRPLADRPPRSDWPAERDRLARWLRQVEAARRLCQQGCPEPQRLLYDYWQRIAGDDTAEQARIARETYQQFCFAAGA
jgi:hypothetical protein